MSTRREFNSSLSVRVPGVRNRLFLATAAAASLLVAVSGCGGSAKPAASGPVRKTVVAPYVDITMSRPKLADVADATGQKTFTLAFALATGGDCRPSWGGVLPLTARQVTEQVNALRERGGSVIAATGGANGPYLENACSSADALARAYAKVLDAVESNRLDVDIEASVPVTRVNEALAKLQRERKTTISYTLRIQDTQTGIEWPVIPLLRDAARRNLSVSVNLMLMNFPYRGTWGQAMVAAAKTAVTQLKELWPDKSEAEVYQMLGLTPMIGRNDSGMVTTQEDARMVVDFARQNQAGFLGFWSISRDNGGCPGRRKASDSCSGVAQSQYEFTTLFKTATQQ